MAPPVYPACAAPPHPAADGDGGAADGGGAAQLRALAAKVEALQAAGMLKVSMSPGAGGRTIERIRSVRDKSLSALNQTAEDVRRRTTSFGSE